MKRQTPDRIPVPVLFLGRGLPRGTLTGSAVGVLLGGAGGCLREE